MNDAARHKTMKTKLNIYTSHFGAIFQPSKMPEAAMEKKHERDSNENVQNPPEEPKRWIKNLGGKRNKDQQENGCFIFKKEQFLKLTKPRL
jgi:hypothetical protein